MDMAYLSTITVAGLPLPPLILAVLIAGMVMLLGLMMGSGRSAKAKKRLKALENRLAAEAAGLDAAAARSSSQPISLDRRKADSGSARMDMLIKRILPRRDLLKQRLEQAGWSMDLGRYLMMGAVLGALSAGAVWQLAGLSLVTSVVCGVAIGLGLPNFFLSRAIARRQKAFTVLFPEAIDLIVRGLRAGLPIQEGFRTVAREIDAPVGPEFQRLTDQIKVGTPVDEALWQSAGRVGTQEFRFFAVSIAVQRETGGNLGETLANLTEIIRGRKQLKLKIKALASEARASAMIVGALPLIMFAVINVINPGYSGMLMYDPRGQIMGAIAIGMMIVGFFIMNRMADFDP